MFRFGRLAAVASSALLALMLLGPTVVSASTPGWYFGTPNDPPTASTIPSLNPDVVSVGANGAWTVTLTNGGTSNISALYLSTDIPKTSPLSNPTYIGNVTYGGGASGPANPCNSVGSGPLYCSFGNLPAGGWVSIDAIAFTVGSPSQSTTYPYPCTAGASFYCFNFAAYGNGNTPSDKGGKSHGDTLLGPVSVDTSSSGNFRGGWVLDNSPLSNAGLSKTNLQSETVTPPTNHIPVVIQDALTSSPIACATGFETYCTSGIGDWMRLSINGGNGGNPYLDGFKIVINVSSKNLPGGTSLSDISLTHVLDDGTAYTLTQTDNSCSTSTLPTVAGVECITVTKVGSNFQIVAWLTNNGGLRI